MAHALLLVDQNSGELKKIIEILEKSYEIYTAANTRDALNVLSKVHIDIIYADIRISDGGGESLLERVMDNYTHITRIILARYADDPLILKAIQKNIAKTSILPPWDKTISEVTNKILYTEDQLKKSSLFTKIKSTEALPTIKSSYRRILQIIDDDGDLDEIASAISADPSITSKLLRIVNSAYYGVRSTSVKHAITYLGTINIRDLILSTSIFDIFNTTDVPERVFQPLWQQSFTSSKITGIAYRMMKKHIPSHAALSGLLMNIGIVFLLKQYDIRYIKLIQSVKQCSVGDKSCALENLERLEFGVTHCEIGGNLLKWWDIPYPFVEAALYHHDPFNENIIDRELVCILHIAEYYSSKTIFMSSEVNKVDECFEYLHIDKNLFEDRILEI